MACRQELGRVAEVPLPDQGGPIVPCLQKLSDRDLVGMNAGTSSWNVIEGQRVPCWVGSCHQSRPRRSAERLCVEIGQSRTLVRHLVQIRSPNRRVSLHRQVAPALVVRHDVDDVWSVRSPQRHGREQSA